MATITISREYGSDGVKIGQEVAELLGYDFVDKRIIEGIFRQYGLTKFNDLYTSAPGFWDLTSATNLLIVSMLNETMEALAYRGNTVILGRGGFASLSGYADVLNVRIQAPLAARVQQVMARENLTDRQQAEAHIRDDDRARRKFIQMFYNKQWDVEAHFDLVIDTGTVTTEMATNWIIEAARVLEKKELPPDAVTTKGLEVDPVLLDAIEKSLQSPLPPLPDEIEAD
ncbi:MAG: cytidylate kinase-like family protein [Anaerolineae bacterium]|nr:cytidylate kinase-like family protein [Anaerolineae bacterium]